MSKFLILRLEGPMQSWGLRGSFDERFTETMPTKSGVVGLLAAAKGVQRGDRDSLEELSSMKMMAVCVKEGSVFKDYHTVGAGHTDKMKQLPKAAGGVKNAVTRRQYLSGYSFLVAFEGEDALVDGCVDALHDPVYPLFLGRKSCIPSRPLLVGVCETHEELESVLTGNIPQEEGEEPRTLADCRVVCEVESGGVLETDVPVDYKARKFASRMVSQDVTDWF